MKRLLLVFLLITACTSTQAVTTTVSSSPVTTVPVTTTEAPQEWDIPGRDLAWHDEFDAEMSAPPDARWWNIEEGGDGWGNQELQFYSGASVTHDGDGHLVIRASESDAELNCWYGDCRYESARITTRDNVDVEYGRVEMRAKLPAGDGLWPAFWMLGSNIDLKGWPNAGEIDIMENIGREPNTVHGTVHGPTYSGADGIGGAYRFSDGSPSEDFHVYAIEWEPDRLTWSVDGDTYATLLPSLLPRAERWVFDHPFFLILNVAVGGAWPGDPSEETVFPQEFVIDYVRVYEMESP